MIARAIVPLGIAPPRQLELHHYMGHIAENAVIADLYKKRANAGKKPVFWFWRDQHNNEVDLLIEENGRLQAIEIKSSQTYNTRLMSGLVKWQQLSGQITDQSALVYAGVQSTQMENGRLFPWRQALSEL